MELYSSFSNKLQPKKLLLLTNLILMIMIMIMITPISTTRSPSHTVDTNTQFIKASCGTTSYPDLCFTTLSSYASEVQNSPKLLATAALTETLKTVRFTSTAMSNLSKNRQDLTAREAEALSDCVEELGDSVEELHRSIEEMGTDKKKNDGSDFELRMSDIKTWVSAALTDEDTCVDGFSDKSMDGSEIKSAVREHIVNVAHVTSNALALVNHYALLHSD